MPPVTSRLLFVATIILFGLLACRQEVDKSHKKPPAGAAGLCKAP